MSDKNPKIVCFDDFELHLERGELRRNDTALAIQPLPLKALILLVIGKGRIVARDEFQNELWPNAESTDVERSLNHTIRKLRQTLGDSSKAPKFVQTVSHRGYRFIARFHQPETPDPVHYQVVASLDDAGNLPIRVSSFREIVDESSSWPPLSDGLREELLSGLVGWRSSGLVVLDDSHLSSADTEDGRPTLAITGSVRRTGASVRILARLVEPGGSVTGTATVQAELGNVFELQQRAADTIIQELILPRLNQGDVSS